MASIALSEAWLHIPILEAHWCFLSFPYNGSHLQYCTLPVRLKLAPRAFTKVLVALIAHLQHQGVSIFPYLDDIFMKALPFPQGEQSVDSTVRCLQRHRFVVSWKKCVLQASLQILHLGVFIGTARDKVFVSQERQEKLHNALQQAAADSRLI